MIKVKKVNAFTDSINGGNPAGVCLNPPDLSDKQMANISKKLDVSETAFISKSDKADFKVRFFSPSIEVALCGHATIATFFTMAKEGYFKKQKHVVISQETKAGVLSVEIFFKDNDVDKVMMTQDRPIIKDIYLDISKVANALNINIADVEKSYPTQIVSTGLFTLPICVNSYKILESMKPDFKKIEKICKEIGVGSFHVITFETIDKNSLYHARNFAPIYSIDEDPVTGTANGAVCSYLLANNLIKGDSFICEQGDIIGKSGRVFVEIDKDLVKVGGRAKIVEEKTIKI